MKTLTIALAGLALVACTSEPAETPSAPSSDVNVSPDTASTANAQTVSLNITGMT
ncbi:MAG: hypothetical protein AAF726_10155 [Planctomycetota bacterium]